MVKEVTIIPKRLAISSYNGLKYGQPLFDFLTREMVLYLLFPQVLVLLLLEYCDMFILFLSKIVFNTFPIISHFLKMSKRTEFYRVILPHLFIKSLSQAVRNDKNRSYVKKKVMDA